MKKTTKSSTKKTSVKAKAVSKREATSEVMDYNEDMMQSPAIEQRKKYLFTILAIFIIVALAGYKFKYLLVPAKVGNQPVFIWQYVSFMHTTYGKEALQTLSTQALINQEIARNHVVVKPEEIQKEIDVIDKQASASGGIKAILEAQQMSMNQLRDQLRIQIAVKQILKDKITPTDAEVTEAYKKNKDFFKGVSEADAKNQVREQLINQKFQTEAGAWLAEVRKNTPVQIYFPGLQ